jgi:repressor LexA
MGLTRKQKQVLDFIREFCASEGVSPSFSDIQDHFGFKSKGSVFDYISYLKKDGHLKEDSSQIELVEANLQTSHTEIPILGTVAAGIPLDVLEDSAHENVLVPESMISGGKHYALRVQGNSMIEDCIMDGDVIVVKSQSTANNGDTVIALVEGAATVKRYYKKSGTIELHPANVTMLPIVVRGGDFKIQGVLAGLMRSY